MTHRILALGAIVALASSLGGCGYALVGRSTNIPDDVQRIFVQTLENLTSRPQVDQILTRAITQEFVTRQRFEVVSERGAADAVLSGSVTGFRVRPVTFVTSNEGAGRAREYEILISTNMRFARIGSSDEILWKQDGYFFRDTYEIQETAEAYFDLETQKIEEVAEKFAETLIIDVLEGF